MKLTTSCCKVKISRREYCKVLGMTKKKKKWGKTRKKWTEYIYIYRYIPRHLSRVCVAQGIGGAQSEVEVDLFGPDAHENATPKAVKVSAGTKSQKKKKVFPSFFFSFSALVCAQHTRGGRNIVCETHRGPLLQCRAARIFKAK